MIDANVLRFLPEIREAAGKHRIDPALLTALVTVETRGRPWATRFEPGFYPDPQAVLVWARKVGVTVDTEKAHQRTSWGLGQVLGAVARERGFKGHIPELCQPALGLEYACLHLRYLAGRHKLAEEGALLTFHAPLVAAYNAGSPIRSKADPSRFVNQRYVDDVREAFEGARSSFVNAP